MISSDVFMDIYHLHHFLEIEEYLTIWNLNTKPFVWTKD